MRIREKDDGDLVMSLDTEEEKVACWNLLIMSPNDGVAEEEFLEKFVIEQDYRRVNPEDVAALTDAPIIEKEGRIWGYMDYEKHRFVRQLAKGRPVIWRKG